LFLVVVVALVQNDGLAAAAADGVTQLNATTFYQMLYDTETKWFDAVIDVRGQDEWDQGHIPNATLVESLASQGTDNEVTTTADVAGCEYCNLVVYCRSGARASQALNHLLAAGFKGNLYNGLGVSQWKAEGYPLVNSASKDSCSPDIEDKCECDECYLTYLAYTSDGVAGVNADTNDGATLAEDMTSNAVPRFLVFTSLAAVVITLFD